MCGRVTVMLLASAISSSLCLQIRALETPEFTREQEFRTRNGALVVRSDSIANGMFIVSIGNRTINVKPTSSSLKACRNVVIDPFEDAFEGEIRATLLQSEYTFKNTIVIWGVGRSEIVNSSRTISYKMLLVDLKECKSKAFRLPDDQIQSYQPILLPEVQVDHNHQKFDVYFTSQQYCSPCEFDSYGFISSTSIQLKAEGAQPAGNFHLRAFYTTEESYGYFYAFNFINGSSVVKLLDMSYRPQRIRYLNHRVDVVSVKIGRIRNVGYCYQTIQSPEELHCERLDSRLQSIVPVLVPLDQPARKVSLEYDEQGNFFVAVALNAEVRVFVYGIFGELLATLDFGQLDQNAGSVRDLSAYIDADQYCLFYSIQRQVSNDASNVVKCINRKKYFE